MDRLLEHLKKHAALAAYGPQTFNDVLSLLRRGFGPRAAYHKKTVDFVDTTPWQGLTCRTTLDLEAMTGHGTVDLHVRVPGNVQDHLTVENPAEI